MASLKWHAFFYDGCGNDRPPSKTGWIEADSASEAMEIARQTMGTMHHAELAPPRWDQHTPPLSVENPRVNLRA